VTDIKAQVACDKKIITVEAPRGSQVAIRGEQRLGRIPAIYVGKVHHKKSMGGVFFSAYVVLTNLVKPTISYVEIVKNFPDVFPEELPGLSHVRQVEFAIDLIPELV